MAGLMVAFWFVLRTGKVVIGMFLSWGLTIICVFLVSVVFPAIVAVYNTEYVALFPEAIAVPAVMFTGWAPAFVVAALAGFVKLAIKHWVKPERPAATQQEQEDRKS